MIQITDKAEYYKQIKSTIPVIADFTAAWCASCKMQKHILAEFENGLKGKIKIITLRSLFTIKAFLRIKRRGFLQKPRFRKK